MKYITNTTPVILAGGLGTRLRSSVPDLPKVIAPVCGRPFIFYILDQVINAGFKEVVICTGYQSEMVREAIKQEYSDTPIIFSNETTPLGTGGSVRHALPEVKTKHLLVMNGDSYVDTDLTSFCDWHFTSQYKASLLLVYVNNAERFGSVKLGNGDIVIDFLEKNPLIDRGLINAGIYILEKSLLESIPLGEKYSLEYDFFPSLIGDQLTGYCCKDRFIDIGTPESYAIAEDFFYDPSLSLQQ